MWLGVEPIVAANALTLVAIPLCGIAFYLSAWRLTGDARSEMTIRDVTPPPVEPGLSEEERWRKAGFSPQGKISL